MNTLTEDQKLELMAVAYLIGPLSENDVKSATSRTHRISAAFKTLAQIKTTLKSKKFPY